MNIRRQIRNLGITLAVVVALVPFIRLAVPVVVYKALAQTVERNTTTTPAYRTTDLGVWTGQIPTQRRVSILDSLADPTAAGIYNPRTAEIELLRGDPRAVEAERHEYGHALLFDSLVRDCSGNVGSALRIDESVVASFSRISDVSTLPKNLQTVAHEYQSQPTTVYDKDGYFTSTLDEFIAESFSRYCAALIVPPTTSKWLRGVEVGRF